VRELTQEMMDTAALESGLAAEYADDPALLALYKRKLLIRGWAGARPPTDKTYCRAIYAMRLESPE